MRYARISNDCGLKEAMCIVFFGERSPRECFELLLHSANVYTVNISLLLYFFLSWKWNFVNQWQHTLIWNICMIWLSFLKNVRNSRRKNPQEEQKKEQFEQSSVFWKVHNRPSHSSIALAVLIWIVFFFSSAGFIWNAQKHGKVSIHTLFFLLSLYPTLPFYL